MIQAALNRLDIFRKARASSLPPDYPAWTETIHVQKTAFRLAGLPCKAIMLGRKEREEYRRWCEARASYERNEGYGEPIDSLKARESLWDLPIVDADVESVAVIVVNVSHDLGTVTQRDGRRTFVAQFRMSTCPACGEEIVV